MARNLLAMQETQITSSGQEGPLEEEMATHSSTVAWRTPWREEPGRLSRKESDTREQLSLSFSSDIAWMFCP